MRKYYIVVVTVFWLTSVGAAWTKEQARPNIVVVLTDDHRADHLGCSGNPIVKTPHIDQLAADGVRFENAFVTTAACTPNRTCILTGQYERKHGVTFSSQSSLSEEAVRDGKWKLVTRSVSKNPFKDEINWELYDMSADMTETRDIAKENAEVVQHLSQLWQNWYAESYGF